MGVSQEQVEAGQAVYTRRTLALYDWFVLGVSNRFVWRCPTWRLLEHYDRYVTGNHLDVGVGTGYFLDRCRFTESEPRIALLDLNADALAYASQRISRYRPEVYRYNVLEHPPTEIVAEITKFDSVGINYLLHCLPGTMESKAVVFDNLLAVMNPNAVLFGATLLQGDVPRNFLAKRFMKSYNSQGIFSNTQDTLEWLEKELTERFAEVSVEVVGCAAVFTARGTRSTLPR
ncbi:class I SAM-dependent methyltransferase [Bythopirellula polymerisocia]|uniref:Methyltransferase domain protein n=1 Tax=Bythopirellula polymerisocia TaxID=2528003 RepID=A0A5C6D3R5_9BACT|nr:class I SAM-dependent methyltransferase [Bythopirellula polymerisocia]TWU29876.1 Methyltransferase domain protein [Bythopirellula polymerisocia]